MTSRIRSASIPLLLSLLCLLPLLGCNRRSTASSNAPNLVATATLVAPPATPAASTTKPADAAVPPSPQVCPIPVVELTGDAHAIGIAHGRALASPIKLLHDKYLMSFLAGRAQRFIALSAATAFESHLLPQHRDEVHALAAEIGMDAREAMLGQCFLDLTSSTACSTVTLPASASPDGVARFGRNLDFPSLNIADKYTTVFIYHPQTGYAFVSVGWPGLVGVLTGMNEHGLTLANMEVNRSPRIPSAMPYTLLYRSVLEQCRTVDEAIAFLQHTPRQTANNLMLMDGVGDRAVVEITPENVVVRKADAHTALISTNKQRGSDADSAGRCRRYDYLHDASASLFGQIDRDTVEQMLDKVSQGNATLQSMVFEPENRVLYLAAGKRASKGTYYRIDLKTRFAVNPPEGFPQGKPE